MSVDIAIKYRTLKSAYCTDQVNPQIFKIKETDVCSDTSDISAVLRQTAKTLTARKSKIHTSKKYL